MTSAAAPLSRHLRRDQFIHLSRPRQLRLRADQGDLWITIDGDPVDIELPAGSSRTFDAGAPLLVGTLGGEAALTVVPVAPQGGWRARLVAALRPLRRGVTA